MHHSANSDISMGQSESAVYLFTGRGVALTFFSVDLRLAATELQIDIKLGVTVTKKNWREKVGRKLVNGAHTHIFPM